MSDNELQDIIDDGHIPAIPPEDYTGSLAQWMIELQTRGLWDGDGWHGDVIITTDQWREILEICEGE